MRPRRCFPIDTYPGTLRGAGTLKLSKSALEASSTVTGNTEHHL